MFVNFSPQSPQSEALLRSIENQTPMLHALYLATTNELVDIHNNKILNDHPGEMRYFKAIDWGSSRVLSGITLCRSVLRLKVGVPVIITKNCDPTV